MTQSSTIAPHLLMRVSVLSMASEVRWDADREYTKARDEFCDEYVDMTTEAIYDQTERLRSLHDRWIALVELEARIDEAFMASNDGPAPTAVIDSSSVLAEEGTAKTQAKSKAKAKAKAKAKRKARPRTRK